jgi:hypothetical protein
MTRATLSLSLSLSLFTPPRTLRSLQDHNEVRSNFPTSLLIKAIYIGKGPKWVGWQNLLNKSDGLSACICCTCCYFQFRQSCFLSNLHNDLLFRLLAVILMFVEDPVSDCAWVREAARLTVYLFRQSHSECSRRNMQSVADLFPVWFSWVNSWEWA